MANGLTREIHPLATSVLFHEQHSHRLSPLNASPLGFEDGTEALLSSPMNVPFQASPAFIYSLTRVPSLTPSSSSHLCLWLQILCVGKCALFTTIFPEHCVVRNRCSTNLLNGRMNECFPSLYPCLGVSWGHHYHHDLHHHNSLQGLHPVGIPTLKCPRECFTGSPGSQAHSSSIKIFFLDRECILFTKLKWFLLVGWFCRCFPFCCCCCCCG